MPESTHGVESPPLPCAEEEARPSSSPHDGEKRVRRRDILNLLNYVNFSDGVIFATFRHLEHGDRLSYQAFPRPCSGDILDCRWIAPGISLARLKAYVCDGFILSDGSDRLVVKAEVTRLDAEGISFKIPESGYERSCRKIDRYPCEGIQTRLIQAGLSFVGKLLDFNALSFRVELEAEGSDSFRWINHGAPINVQFSRGAELLYSGDCIIRRSAGGHQRREVVLSPNFSSIQRYKPKKYRNERYILSPSPIVRFEHPLTGKSVDLQVKDISGTGLCVEESFDRSVLLPGLLIPELFLELASQVIFSCKAQVLYRNVASGEDGEDSSVRCGIVFLDMDMPTQVKLSASIFQSADDRLRVCGKVDTEELWRFFFGAGFIYPSKYLSIEAHKEEFKRTYEKLYLNSPTIARHFLFLDKGRICGHSSMLRFYSNSWLFHHHAATRDGYGLAGVKVFELAGRYCNDFHSHPSTHMDYLMCYFRPENRFPARVFGNIARDVAQLKGSSLDTFAYLRLPSDVDNESTPFQLFPACDEDFAELRRFYEAASGGLALDVLDLGNQASQDAELSSEYARQGFRRERKVFCLRQEGRLGAVIAITLSDLGLNLSGFTNCVHVFVLDGERLLPQTIFSGLKALLCRYSAEEIPILAYPCDYLDGHSISYEKKYILWAISLTQSDAYYSSMRNTFRRACNDAADGRNGDN